MLRHPFLQAIETKTLLADGAMGTMLYARGLPTAMALEQANLTQPDIVRAIHLAYIEAGADIIETNTFSANRIRLARFGLESSVRAINFQGARLARDAREILGQPVFVAGAVGPVGPAFPLQGNLAGQEVRAAFREQVEALLEGGVDLILLETFPDLTQLRLAIETVKATCDLPVVAQVNFQADHRTLAGEPPDEVVNVLLALGADVVGVNCGVGPLVAVEWIEQMAQVGAARLSVQPNAGQPRMVGGRAVYPSTPAYFAAFARQALDLGTAIVGGCCGTTPEHTAAMRAVIGHNEEPAPLAGPPTEETLMVMPEQRKADETAPQTLREKLAAGRFVVSVEIDPPRGTNPRKALEGAAMLKGIGVDAINVGDSPMARVRMSALALCVLLSQQVGIETLLHFTTRDRNLMAIQADLIGAHALGLRNIIALTGDPPSLGDYAGASGVWNVDSIGLIRIIKRLNEGVDWAGNSIGRPTDFFIACAANPTAENLDLELDRVRQKIDAGADLLMTQPVYDYKVLVQFLERLGAMRTPVLVGIMPLQSSRHAEFIHNELAGVVVPQSVRDRMRLAGENGIAEGLAISMELLEEVRDGAAGVYLMPSFGRYEVVAELARAALR
jgi:homocysteine S-methyltransferase